ncbi:hypothetical protein GMJAKD_13535 [Candidatus Electrothrix aarhusensis]
MEEEADNHRITRILAQSGQHSQTDRQGLLRGNKEQGLAVFGIELKQFCGLTIDAKKKEVNQRNREQHSKVLPCIGAEEFLPRNRQRNVDRQDDAAGIDITPVWRDLLFFDHYSEEFPQNKGQQNQ